MTKMLASSCLVLFNIASTLPAQDPIVASRAEQIEQERIAKAAALSPPAQKKNALGKTLDLGTAILLADPVRLKVGGLPGGSGLALGPELRWTDDTQTSLLKVSAVGTLRRAYGGNIGTETNLARRRVSILVDGDYFNKPRFDYYGPGPDSSKSNRTQYREENTFVNLGVRWEPTAHFTSGVGFGPLFVNVGPGTNNRIASTDTVFGASEAPGIDTQTNYLVSSSYIEFQNLDLPKNPTAGTRGTVAFRHYADIKRRGFTFERLSAQATHYIPFFNEKRVIALRAGTELSFKDPDQTVPFYLQTTLGGPDDLRGYRRYRFYDNDSMIFSAEYRWEVSTGFVMAAFGDAGQVFSKASQISWTKLQSDVGFGFRIHTRDYFTLRVDAGFSHEGAQVWLQIENAF